MMEVQQRNISLQKNADYGVMIHVQYHYSSVVSSTETADLNKHRENRADTFIILINHINN